MCVYWPEAMDANDDISSSLTCFVTCILATSSSDSLLSTTALDMAQKQGDQEVSATTNLSGLAGCN